MKRLCFYFLTILAFPSLLFAADNDSCMALLSHGLYDEFISLGLSNNYSEISNEVCSAYERLKKDKKSGNAQAEYKLFGGSASFSASKLETVSKFMCQSEYSLQTAMNESSTFSKVINPQAVKAFTDCVSQSKKYLIVNTDYGTHVTDSIVISLKYVAPENGQITVEKIEYDKECLDCSGALLALVDKNEKLGSKEQAIRCKRILPKTTENVLGEKLWLRGTDVTINTGAGTIVRRLPAIVAKPEKMSDSEKRLLSIAPVGTVVASILSWEDFKKTGKDVDKYWLPADNRPLPRDSDLSKYFNLKYAPDLRGSFIRGINKFAKDELKEIEKNKADPDGVRSPGNFQFDALQDHNHTFTYHKGGNKAGGGHNIEGPNRPMKDIWPVGGVTDKARKASETRPKNTAVYFYIKIN
jgi:hypothetical protein